jgi:hypothetical protein
VFTRAPDDGRHYTRTAFTDILRYRLVGAARHLGIDIDVKAFFGVSFRKGSLQTAADVGTPGYALADLGDHSSVDMTRFYVGDTVAGRAARTAAIGGGFDGVSPERPALGPALPQFEAPCL